MNKHYFGIVCAAASLAMITGCVNEDPEELEDQLAAIEEADALGDMDPDLDAEWLGYPGVGFGCPLDGLGLGWGFPGFGWGLGFGKPIIGLGAYGIGYPGYGFYPGFGCGCGGAIATTTTVVAGGGCGCCGGGAVASSTTVVAGGVGGCGGCLF